MSEKFTLGTLIALVRGVRSLASQGDTLPEALSDEHRQILIQAAHAMVDRLVHVHTAPQPGAPTLSIRDLLHMAKAADAFLVQGDEHPAPLSADQTSIVHLATQVMLHRVAKHPNGDLVAEAAMGHPMAAEARAKARAARELIASRQRGATEAPPRPAPEPEAAAPTPARSPDTGAAAVAADFRPAPVPARDPAPEQQDSDAAFRFSTVTATPGLTIERRPPEPAVEAEPVNLGPTQPAPVTPPEAGQPQAQAAQ